MNINDVLAKASPGTICGNESLFTVSHYPDPPDIYHFTGETEKDEQGYEVQVIKPGVPSSEEETAAKTRIEIYSLNQQIRELQEILAAKTAFLNQIQDKENQL